jgi:hypothetical protein
MRRMTAVPFQGLPGRARLMFMAPFLASRVISFRRSRQRLETGESRDRLLVLESVLEITHSIKTTIMYIPENPTNPSWV